MWKRFMLIVKKSFIMQLPRWNCFPVVSVKLPPVL